MISGNQTFDSFTFFSFLLLPTQVHPGQAGKSQFPAARCNWTSHGQFSRIHFITFLLHYFCPTTHAWVKCSTALFLK